MMRLRLLLFLALASCGDAGREAPIDTAVGLRVPGGDSIKAPLPQKTVLLKGVRGVAAVLETGDGLLVSSAEPAAVQLFDVAGAEARRVRGVALRRPGSIILQRDTVSVLELASAQAVRYAWPTLDSVAAAPLPWTAVGIGEACDRIVVAYETRIPDPAHGVLARAYAIAALGTPALAQAAAHAAWPGNTTAGLDLVADPSGVRFPDAHGRIQHGTCAGDTYPEVAVPYPADWKGLPHARGFAVHVAVAFYFFRHREGAPVTYGAECSLVRATCETRELPGVYALAGSSGGVVWLAREDNEGTTLFKTTVESLHNWLQSEGRAAEPTRRAPI